MHDLIIDKKDSNCNRKYFNVKNTYIYPLNNGQQWIITLKANQQSIFVCVNRKPIEYFISSPSIDTLNDTLCKIPIDSNILVPSITSQSELRNERINFNFSKDELFLFQNNNVQLNLIQPDLHLEQLQINAINLERAYQQYEDSLISTSRADSFKYYSLSTLVIAGYISLVVILFTIMYKFGWLNCFIRPFKLVFFICFDARESAPQNHPSTVKHNPSTVPLIAHYSTTPSRDFDI